MKLVFAFLLAVIYNFNAVGQSKMITGQWQPQKNPNGCWAATLSNVSRLSGSQRVLTEEDFNGNYPFDIHDLDQFSGFAKKYYNYEIVRDNLVLSWEAIKQNIDYRNAKPMIYSFQVTESVYHFVNIIGYHELNTPNNQISKWLYIYDPKPDSVGTCYLKNYLSYKTVGYNGNEDPMRSTMHQFAERDSLLRDTISNASIKGIPAGQANECTTRKDILGQIRLLFSQNLGDTFKEVSAIVKDSLYVINSSMEITQFEESVRQRAGSLDRRVVRTPVASDTTGYQVVSEISQRSELIPFVTLDSAKVVFRTGVIIRNLYEDCWIIDEIMDIRFLNSLDSVNLTWTRVAAAEFPTISINEKLTLALDKHLNRFLKIKSNNKVSYFDIQGRLNKQLPRTFDRVAFNNKFMRISSLNNTIKVHEFDLHQPWNEQRFKDINKKLPNNLKITSQQYISLQKKGGNKMLISIPNP